MIEEKYEEKKMSQPRFWEFYFVRYFVGTAVGFVIVMFLLFDKQSPLDSEIFLGVVTVGDLTSANIFLLSAIGLAFCYISSAPVLVLHALRCAYDPQQQPVRSVVGPLFVVGIPIVAVGFALAKHSGVDPFRILGWVFVLLVVGVQVILYVEVILKKAQVDGFYKKLAAARAKGDETAKEYIESYRHLREHGNAFFIVVFESGLGASMYLMKSSGEALLALFVWLSPAAFVWFIGTYLEYRLVRGE